MKRREYDIEPITVNKIVVTKVLIDSHYEEKHGSYLNDEMILRLVFRLDGRVELPEAVEGDYSYFVTLLELDGKQYRLIWLLESQAIYVGVINAYRDDRRS